MDRIMDEKTTCSRCHKVRPTGDFGITSTGRRKKSCRRCLAAKTSKYRSRTKETARPKQHECMGGRDEYKMLLRKPII